VSVIEFSDEQAMLLDTAVDFCTTQSPIEKVRKQIDDQTDVDADQWKSMVELGWLAISIPEANGGLGLSLADVVPITESMGRQLMGSPFLSTTLATQAILAGGNDALQAEWLPKIASLHFS